jgi:hypothetical protein
MAELQVRHAVLPGPDGVRVDPEPEALRAEGEVVDGELRLSPEPVGPDQREVVPETTGSNFRRKKLAIFFKNNENFSINGFDLTQSAIFFGETT